MANTKLCSVCSAGNPANCVGRWQSPSNRKVETGTPPKRASYSYKCPNR